MYVELRSQFTGLLQYVLLHESKSCKIRESKG